MREYKRLTQKTDNGIWGIDGKLVNQRQASDKVFAEAFGIIINRLAELEDKIENGTLIELPCNVGDTIFFEGFRNGSESIGILEHKVVGFSLKVLTKGKDDIVPTDIPIKDFVKDVFFTKEELKNYLKELSK